MNEKEKKTNLALKLGTFGGVFVPNILTILGVILFMRTGWVVGQAGLTRALVILVIANSITFFTSLSLSAVSTNARVGAGGAYYIISRSLGLEIGGSIGVPLFLAQAVSVAFYVIGFTESLLSFFPDLKVLWVAGGVTCALFVVTWVGSDWAVKAQYGIFGVLCLSLLSFFCGIGPENHLAQNQGALFSEGVDFWMVFAIFFPAVTGVMSGASMSGDLRDPAKSIPRGTLGAVVVTFLIYVAQMWWLARNVDRETLLENPLVMKEVALVPWLIYAGIWAATLSSALASLLAAPRTMQALAGDGVLPRIFARKSGKKKEPRIALVATLVLALGCVTLGRLDVIAPVITMFFLITYGMLNLVAFMERLVANPSYRPTFQVHWIFPLLGAAGCLWIMFLLNAGATVAATVLMVGLYFFLTQRRYQTAWGDTRSGLWFAIMRFALKQFSRSAQHMRNWRPVILVLMGKAEERTTLVQFANWLGAKRGFLYLGQIIVGIREKVLPRVSGVRKSLDTLIAQQGIFAAVQVITAEDYQHGVTNMIEGTGVGPICPNTVLLGWSEDPIAQERFRMIIQRIFELEKNLMIFGEADEETAGSLRPYIDVWWRWKKNGALMATLAHLLHTNARWRKHQVRILMIVDNLEGVPEVKKNMTEHLREARVQADLHVITKREGKNPMEMIAEHSEYSEVCFLGINLEPGASDEAIYRQAEKMIQTLKGNVFLTRNWQAIEF